MILAKGVCRRSGQRGSILIAVIAMIAMLAVFSAAVNRQVSQEMMFGRWLMARSQTLGLAKAGVQRALYEIQADKVRVFDALNESWASNGTVFSSRSLGDGTFSVICDEKLGFEMIPDHFHYGACDESARLNINKLNEDQLKRLFKVAVSDLTDKEISEMAEAVIDWRDPDDAALPQGAEGNYYKALSQPYEPRNGNLESVEELLMIRGITAEIYKKIRPYVTVYTDGKVNFNTAPSEVLQVLGLSPDLAERVVNFRRGPDLKDGTKDDVPFQYADGIAPELSAAGSFSPEDFAQISNAVAQGIVSVQSDVFRIYSLGRLIRGTQNEETLATCVINRKGSILYWKEGRS